MRLLAWNINHRTTNKDIPKQMADSIAALEPDIVVLTEFVPGESRASFLAELTGYGFCNQLVSDKVPIENLKSGDFRIGRENHVFIASRLSCKAGYTTAPLIESSVPTNFLHVVLEEDGLNIFGIRIPDYSKQLPIKRACWDWLISMADKNRDVPSIILGDLNTDPNDTVAKCGNRIKMLEDQGWQRASPIETSSFKSNGRCIDHAFVTHHYKITSAQYIASKGNYIYMGNDANAMSDHAALILEITKDQGRA